MSATRHWLAEHPVIGAVIAILLISGMSAFVYYTGPETVKGFLARAFLSMHIWGGSLLIAGFILWCLRHGEKPTDRQFIELMAYVAGFWGALRLLIEAYHKTAEGDMSWYLVSGGVVLGYAAFDGAMSIFESIRNRAAMRRQAPPPAPAAQNPPGPTNLLTTPLVQPPAAAAPPPIVGPAPPVP